MPEYSEIMMKKENLMSTSVMMMQSLFQSQSSATSQHHQKIWSSLRQDTRSLRTERRERKMWRRQSRRLPLLHLRRRSKIRRPRVKCELQLSPVGIGKILVNGVDEF